MKTTAMLALVSASVASAQYRGHQVLQCSVEGADLGAPFQDLIAEQRLDVWGSSKEGTLDMRVPGNRQTFAVRKFFKEGGCEVLIPDMQANIDEFDQQQKIASQSNEWFESYHEYQPIVDWYRDLAGANPDLVTYTPSIGLSYEGRAMPAVKVTSQPQRELPAFYIQCQIHAREWISGASCMYVVDKLIEDYRRGDAVARNVLDNSHLHIVPLANPDGYQYTHTTQRLWRKNRSPNAGSTCVGTDLNRNWNSKWGQGGSSMNPCSDTYMGASADSEIETKNSIAYFRSIAPVIGAIDMHAYGQLILRPNGWTTAPAKDEERLKEIGAGMQAAILAESGNLWSNTPSHELYVTTGSAQDWFYDDDATRTNEGIRAAGYTLELRPVGANPGFQLPPDQIIDASEETYRALRFFFEDLLREPIRA